MTGSILYTAFGYKIVIELKRSLKKIWDEESKDTRRKKMETLIYKFFKVIDESGTNEKFYKDRFSGLSDAQFDKYFKGFFENDKAYLIIHEKDYKYPLTMDEIEAGAKVLNVPLFEYVSFPHINMDTGKVVVTKKPVPVGYILEKRTQQTVDVNFLRLSINLFNCWNFLIGKSAAQT